MGLGSGGCDPRIEAIVKLKSQGSDWVGFGGCEPQIEDIVKLKKSGSGWWGLVGGQVGWGLVGGSTNVNQELKVLLKEHKGILQLITVKNM